MSKLFFRWLRGEINGAYLTNFYDALNLEVKEVKDFLVNFKTMQFNDTMSSTTLFNLGKFASVFIPRYTTPEKTGSMTFSESYVVDGEEYSERGLYDTEREKFDYVHTTQEEGLSDINTLATETNRSSLVGDEAVRGYIASSNTDVLNDEGKVKPSVILSEPPSGEAYSEFYSDDFLFLSEGAGINYSNINSDLYVNIYKALQWIRYNGVSLKSLLRITSILCPEGFVKINSIVLAEDNKHYIIYYVADESSTVTNKVQRLYLLDYLIQLKFKQFILSSI